MKIRTPDNQQIHMPVEGPEERGMDLHHRLLRLLQDPTLSAEQKDSLAQQVLAIVCGNEAQEAA